MDIHIGEYYASRNPSIITTLVGSCVAVCLYDPKTQIGGMNHILLPGKADIRHYDAPARYGINAMELLINKIMRLGGNRGSMISKVFGGGHIIPHIPLENGVGRKNLEFVFEFLANESIPVRSKDVGGIQSRRIYFDTLSGDAFVKRVRPLHWRNIIEKEKKLLKHNQNEVHKTGTITLFYNFTFPLNLNSINQELHLTPSRKSK